MVPQWCTQCAALHLLCLLQGVLKHRNRLQLERDNLKEEREKKQKVLSDPKVQANPQKHDKLSQEFTKVKCVWGGVRERLKQFISENIRCTYMSERISVHMNICGVCVT